jgi:dihydrofolate reductase
MIKGIMACDSLFGVGNKGELPWPSIKEDFRWFKENTIGHVVVMGSGTWDGLGMFKPLPRRINIVLSKQNPSLFQGAEVLQEGDTLEEKLRILEARYPGLIIWVIGGAELIHDAMPYLDQFYLTRINGVYEADVVLKMDEIIKHLKLDSEVPLAMQVKAEIWHKK